MSKTQIFALCLALASCRMEQPLLPSEAKQAPRASSDCLDLNTATAKELEGLPGIGEVIAQRIIRHRERQGPFQRPEEVIIIEGVSETKYLAIAHRLCAGD